MRSSNRSGYTSLFYSHRAFFIRALVSNPLVVHVEIYAAMLREGPREHEKTCGEPPFSEQPAVQLQVLP